VLAARPTLTLSQSLIAFILPGKFNSETIDSLRTIFKVRADAHASLLSRERVSRAKTMMTPFVLRRRKDQVGPLDSSALTR
jgi:SWI/SNF-related matrix-associated actin-dependent regulator 1 of chromatin subfamily A